MPINWQPLRIGAGGYISGIDIAPDGTMVGRTDTYGAYIWNGTQWQQLVTSTSLPAAIVELNQSSGVYEIQIAPSNTNIFYMEYLGDVFVSTDKGTTWSQTSFSKVTDASNDPYRGNGQKMAVDPNNPNVVYVGTPQSGMFVTTDGGVTWQNVSAVPASRPDNSGNYPGITGILFDPAFGGVTGGKTNTIFAASYGNGVYETINGGVSWSLLAGSPTYVTSAAVSSTGVYYAVDGASLWSYANGTWRQLVSNGGNGMQSVAVNPANPNEIITQSPAGYLNVSYDGGLTWSGIDWASNSVSSTDIPWQVDANTNQIGAVFMAVGGLAFNPLVPNEVIASAGTGIWTASIPQSLDGGTPVTWSSKDAGIEQLVANSIIVPPGGKPVIASWDRPFFYVANPDAYPSTYGPVNSSQIVMGWSLDYASSDPRFLVGIADNWGIEESGYSTDGGQTWTPFAAELSGAIGGTIAASSPTDIVWAPSSGHVPYYTTNGGSTWNPVVLPGVSDWSVFDFAYYLDRRTVTADRVLANTFYLYYIDAANDSHQGVYRSTNGGQTWAQVSFGQITPFSGFNAEIESVPGKAGNLFFTGGSVGGTTLSQPANEPFMRSADGGATWTAVPNVLNVNCFGFGASATPGGYPTIYIVGWVNNVYGIWQSDNNAQSWVQIGPFPNNSLDQIKTISGDPNIYGQVYVGFSGSGYAYLPAAPTTIPAAPTLALGTGVSNGATLAEATQTSGVVTVTGELNDAISVTFANGAKTVTETLTGTGSAQAVTLTATDVSTLTDGTISVNATQTDAAGTAVATTSFVLDTTAPSIAINAIARDDVVSAREAKKGFAISGTTVGAENGQTVTIEILNGSTVVNSYTTSVANDAWSVKVSKTQATALGDGNYTVSADVSDNAGNPAVEVTRALTVARHPVNILTVTATNSTPEETGTSAPKTIKVTDPPAPTLTLADAPLQKLDASAQFTGQVSGFSGQALLDLAVVAFGSHTTLGYAANNSNPGGAPTVSDGTHTANIALLGQYMAGTFVTSADGFGGSLIHDSPPATLTQTLTQPQHA